ncbi:MAG: 16S rRNA (guanine(966)-N(2))-methyltransferase RsmD [Desulfobacula sp.]|nr:16S rRNA (guanine(966)-N(2))-methyltransferase RsmD [Desulfobacula sp.]
MRIISGSCRGRKLVRIHSKHIRPTSDRTREAVFNILGQKIKNARVLDLFAGTGALGIEALSRGAKDVTFIDRACDVIHQNLDHCKLNNRACVIILDLAKEKFPISLFGQAFDIIFIDPPYGKGLIEHTFKKNRFMDLLAEDSVIIAEYSHKENIEINTFGLDILKQKKYSKTRISIINKN